MALKALVGLAIECWRAASPVFEGVKDPAEGWISHGNLDDIGAWDIADVNVIGEVQGSRVAWADVCDLEGCL